MIATTPPTNATALYARVSTEEQQARGTIETQIQHARHRLGPDLPVFADEGISGTVPLSSRPAGARLLEALRAGQIREVAVFRLDRLGRDPRVILDAVAAIEETGAVLRSLTEPFETETAAGRLMLTMLSGFAGFERESILERSREGTNRLARAGAWLGGIVPYGYRVEGQDAQARLVPSDALVPGTAWTEADLVRQMFAWIGDEGHTCVWVAERLTALGIPPSYARDGRGVRGKRTSGIWRPGRVRNLIVSPTYYGLHVWGKRSARKRETIEREVPALISQDLWQRAQATLRRNLTFATRNCRREYLLRGLIKCGCCGLTYSGTSYQRVTGQRSVYYACNGRIQGRGVYGMEGKRCPSAPVPGRLEEAVWADILALLSSPETAIRSAQGVEARRLSSLRTARQSLAAIERAIEGKASERDAVLSLFRRGRIGEADLDRQLDQVAAEEARLRQEFEAAQSVTQEASAQEAMHQRAATMLRALSRVVGDDRGDYAFRRSVVEAIVERIEVTTTADTRGKKQARATVHYRLGASAPGPLFGTLTPDLTRENGMISTTNPRKGIPADSNRQVEAATTPPLSLPREVIW